MTKLWIKIKAWFKPKPAKKKPVSQPKLAKTQPTKPVKPFNEKHYRQLIGKIASRAIAEQRRRTQERRNL